MTAIITLVLANLPAIISLGKSGYDLVHAIRVAAQQSGEWSDAAEAEFQKKLADEEIDPAWLPDAK